MNIENRKRIDDLIVSSVNQTMLAKNVDCKFCEDTQETVYTITYDNFKALIAHTSDFAGYSFLEGSNDGNGDSIFTKFKFDFSDIKYSIYDVHNAVDDRIFDTYIFHDIKSEDDAKRAIDTVLNFIGRNYTQISLINSNTELQNKLNDSFAKGLKLASKKITMEQILNDSKKEDGILSSVSDHDTNLSNYRIAGENEFYTFARGGSSNIFKNFLAKQSAKGKLLPYEQRFFDYLLQNDFQIDPNIKNRIKSDEKKSRKSNALDIVVTLISAVLAFAIPELIFKLVSVKLEENYTLLFKESNFGFWTWIILCLGFSGVFGLIQMAFQKSKAKGYRKSQLADRIKIQKVLAVIGSVLVVGSCVYCTFSARENIGIGESDIYYCESLTKVEHLNYDDLSFYLIEGEYYDDEYFDTDDYRLIIIVKDNDYENFMESSYLSDINLTKEQTQKIKFKGTYKDIQEFQKAMNLL